MCKKNDTLCVKLHTVCEITQCAQNNTYSIGKNSSQLKNFTLTPWAALATNMSCAIGCFIIAFFQQKKVHSSINQESILRTIWGLKTAEFAYKVAPLESVGGPTDPKMDH